MYVSKIVNDLKLVPTNLSEIKMKLLYVDCRYNEMEIIIIYILNNVVSTAKVKFELIVFMKADYESTLAPKTISTLSGSRTSEPLPIFLNLDILSFDKVDNLNMMFR